MRLLLVAAVLIASIATQVCAESLLTTVKTFAIHDGPELGDHIVMYSDCEHCSVTLPLDYMPSLSFTPGPFALPIDISFEPGISGNSVRLDDGFAFEGFARWLENDSLPDSSLVFTVPTGGPIHPTREYLWELWGNPFTPPNGVTLLGTGLKLSAIEFTLTDVVPDVTYTDLLGTRIISRTNLFYYFDLRFYAVPEASTSVLLLLCCSCLPPVRRRG